MGRIRSIKPEFPHSESMGRVSRDARLLFLMLFTIVDDEGRCRAASRMLASLLFPYDQDAGGLIDGWLAELEREGCLVRYAVSDSSYLEIRNWKSHQRIDHPSESKIPPSPSSLANPRESSRTTPLGGDGKGEDQEGMGSGKDEEGTPRPAAQVAVAANAALRSNPKIGNALRELTPGQAEEYVPTWIAEGIPLPLIIETVTRLCLAYQPKTGNGQPKGFKYFDGAIREAFERGKVTPKAAPDVPTQKLKRLA